jgi:Subtilase family
MRWDFPPEREDGQAEIDDENSAQGLQCLPAALLQRHGARVLNPADAAVVPGQPLPRSTVYRAKTLLIPEELLAMPLLEGDLDNGPVSTINSVLAQVGFSLMLPESPHNTAGDAGAGDGPSGAAPGGVPAVGTGNAGAGAADGLPRLPRKVVLAPAAAADGQAAAPVVVDAWVALQMLRAVAAAQRDPYLDARAVSQISLEHVLIGSAITGSPITEGGGLTGSPITEGGGVTGPGPTDSYLYAGGDARTPVQVSLDAPARRSTGECVSRYGRRPVVAVLDTGVREHPWLGVASDPRAPGGYRTTTDSFVAVDQAMQDAIYAQDRRAAVGGDQPGQLIRYPWDVPVTADSLVGELDTHTGHGTFIAGIVRQVAPDAEVLSVRIMHSDGVVYESDLTCALHLIAQRIAAALRGDMAKMVDVVSLSLGYFSESAADVTYSSGLLQVIDAITGMGVPVVAAAGNYSTSRRFYPAAFAERPAADGHAPVISVGALNPNGSTAVFSDGGNWIRAWATGAATISTFPCDVNGSREPEIDTNSHAPSARPAGDGRWRRRAALDPDDYRGGFAAWSGTSFAAPEVAGRIAKAMLQDAERDQGLRLDLPGAAASAQRTARALQRLDWRS